MNAGSNIRYVRFQTSQGTGYGCFAISWERAPEKFMHYKIGASFCSPKDSFNKDIAKNIAKGRLSRNNTIGIIKSANNGYIIDNDFDSILYDVFTKENTYSPIPNWARKAFSRGKYLFTLSSNRIM